MKVRMTVDVPDNARAYIARIGGGKSTQTGLADRDAVIEHVEKLVTSLDEAAALITPAALQDHEIGDAAEAVTYLRAQGKTDSQIRAWLFMQKARFAVALAAK